LVVKRDGFATQPFSSPPSAAASPTLPRAKAIGTPVFFVPKPEEGEVRSAQAKSADLNVPHRIENYSGQAFGTGEPARNDSPARSSYANSVADGRSDSGRVSFSTGHIFPAEKEVAENRSGAEKNIITESVPPRPVPPKLNSFRISPVSLGGKDQYEQDHE
jgi:hypothetical protein